jgi:2-iminobutanoate/2-iminopropanoate deaminase
MRTLNPGSVPAPVGKYVHAVEVEGPGSLLFISGQIPETLAGSVPESFEDQCRLTWSHIGNILAAAGLGFGDLIKVTTFLSDRGFADANGRIRREVLGSHEPSLTVVCASMLDARWLLEIEAIAGKSRGGSAEGGL